MNHDLEVGLQHGLELGLQVHVTTCHSVQMMSCQFVQLTSCQSVDQQHLPELTFSVPYPHSLFMVEILNNMHKNRFSNHRFMLLSKSVHFSPGYLLQARSKVGFDELFDGHVSHHRDTHMLPQLIGGAGAEAAAAAPQPPQGGRAAEVACGMCHAQFEVPRDPLVDVTRSKTVFRMSDAQSRSRQLFVCGDCARERCCWGQLWGLGDGGEEEEGADPMETA